MTSGAPNIPLYGLVLAGGKSVRMGEDKGMLNWHGIPQRYYMANLLSGICAEVYISCREEQAAGIDSRYLTITDSHKDAGPIGGILSAFERHGAVAWLVLACDLPLLDAGTLKYLVDNRNPAAIATTFKSPYDGLPEPLVTIWEPESYPILLAKINDGMKCPRKALINSNAHILEPPNKIALTNANTPADAGLVKAIINNKTTNDGI